jgi:hypothetical protein
MPAQWPTQQHEQDDLPLVPPAHVEQAWLASQHVAHTHRLQALDSLEAHLAQGAPCTFQHGGVPASTIPCPPQQQEEAGQLYGRVLPMGLQAPVPQQQLQVHGVLSLPRLANPTAGRVVCMNSNNFATAPTGGHVPFLEITNQRHNMR